MKTKNWKLCILAIFLAVCFTICAGNCYSQTNYPQTYNTLNTLNALNWGSLNFGYQSTTGLYYPTENFPVSRYGSMWGGKLVPVYGWVLPGGKTTLDFLQELTPGHYLTYEQFYGMKYEPKKVIVSYKGADYQFLDPFPGPYPEPFPGPYPYPFPSPFPDITYGNFSSMGAMDGRNYGMGAGFSSPFDLGNTFTGIGMSTGF